MLKIKVRVLLTLIFIVNNLFWAVQVRSDDGGAAAGKSSSKEVNSTVEVDFESIIGVTGGKFNFYGFKSGMSESQLSTPAKLNGLRDYATYVTQEKERLTKKHKDEFASNKRLYSFSYESKTWATSDERDAMELDYLLITSEQKFYKDISMYKRGSRFAKLRGIGFSFIPYFTTQNKLWRLDVMFRKNNGDLLEQVAQRVSIQEKFNTDFPGIEMKRDRANAKEFYLFQFVDYDVANASIAHHKSRFDSNLNH